MTADGATALRDVFLYIAKVTDLPENEIRQFLTVEIGPESEQLVKTTYDRLLDQGRAEGRVEGRATLLLSLLTERFGPPPADVTNRVRAASVEQLDVWARNLLGAGKLEDVFAG